MQCERLRRRWQLRILPLAQLDSQGDEIPFGEKLLPTLGVLLFRGASAVEEMHY